MKKICFLAFLVTFAIRSQNDPYQKIKPLPEKLHALSFGSVKPRGWLKDQIQQNLNGFTGHLDELAPDLITNDDIYDKNRLSKKVKSKDVGAIGGEGDWQVQFLWWNSETQSNWRDGYIRSAILADDNVHLTQIKTYIDGILASQDKDGYLGIYDEELRYKFDNENGELWAKATLLRGLLAWFDYSKDEKVLTAIKRAVQNTMDNYPINASHPFYSKNENVGGLSHGLTFTDVLEDLHRITNDQKYLDYALFLYKDFSENKLNEDAQYAKLMDKTKPLNGHGVHTYEHLRSLASAYQASGNPELSKAIVNFEAKILTEITATGGPVGDEWIGSKKADATNRGYEYCSIQELMHSYESLLAKTANMEYADKIETMFFNAAQGARHPEKSGIAYLKTDNSYAMSGGLNGDESEAKQTRYRYSPVHKEAAVCCVPNAGRIAPYYVQYMWLKSGNSLMAALLGPCQMETMINGKKIRIREITEYPHHQEISFEIDSETDFELKVRKPEWATATKIENAQGKEENGYLIFDVKRGSSSVKLLFLDEFKVKQDVTGEFYFSRGGIVYALPIAADEMITKKYNVGDFADIEYSPTKPIAVFRYDGKSKVGSKTNIVQLLDSNGKMQNVELKPVSETILRQVTFKAVK